MSSLPRNDLPLYVDLDGTLVSTDTLWENLVALARQNPKTLVRLLPTLRKGKAFFKSALAENVIVHPQDLPYHDEVVQFLRNEKSNGRRLILATASHETVAQAVADHLALFDAVIASNTKHNLRGEVKRDAIREHAQGPYEYLGDHIVDLPIWQDAARAHAVLRKNADWHHSITTEQRGQRFQAIGGRFIDLLKAMRPHQWAKNLLLFLPLLLSHTFTNPYKLTDGILAVISFSFTASSIYLINDIFDIHSDRRHPEKRLRPFARGVYAIPTGFLASTILMLIGLGIGAILSPLFCFCLLGYIVTTCLYTAWLKKRPIVDVILIGFFYTYRIFAGAIATETLVTDWLLAFATFFFVSMGIEKRYGELLRVSEDPTMKANGRGYQTSDLPLLLTFGVNTSFLSLLVLALYVRSIEVTKLYTHPSWLWGVVILLLMWIMRFWLLAHRGIVRDDPLLFTLKDRKGALLFLLMAAVLILAAI
jgi:4-hydroxybenzoate polyprenyltransferase